jgi:hypothetical protein
MNDFLAHRTLQECNRGVDPGAVVSDDDDLFYSIYGRRLDNFFVYDQLLGYLLSG